MFLIIQFMLNIVVVLDDHDKLPVKLDFNKEKPDMIHNE
jgi:hypothetical protein